MQRLLTIILFLITVLTVRPTEDFTHLEQQQISIETPGLFAHSSAFQVDFSQYKKGGFSFPLPVGKIENVNSSEIEIETSKGDAVKAMFDGTIRLSRRSSTHGNVIVVRHHNGLETVYAHNAQNLVRVGDQVKAGQTIAIVGGAGGRTYCLFSIMVNGRRINPEIILDVKAHALHSQIATFKKTEDGIEIKTTRKEPKNKEPKGMSMDTNNPFGDKAVYRLDLDAIKSFRYPLDDSHVISGYGGKRRHSGVDIKNAPKKEIYAVFDGLVVQAGTYSAYGKCITIRHANGLETRYSHNSKNLVTVGDKVKAGDVIALTGRTGRATTEHLHFETRINGRAFNPDYVLDHKNHCLQKGVLQFKKGGGVSRLK